MSGFSKQRTTCAIASTSRITARNWLPSPSPREAPLTSPAMSTKAIRVGTILADLASFASTSRRGSGTATSPILASMVLNGYFAACAAAVSVKALKSVDLPTFGNPTMPHLKPIGLFQSASFSSLFWNVSNATIGEDELFTRHYLFGHPDQSLLLPWRGGPCFESWRLPHVQSAQHCRPE